MYKRQVHAAGQVINFRTNGTIPIDRLCIAMNSLLPVSIAALEAEEGPPDFHARYSARSRLYRYDILNRGIKSALQGRFAWHVISPLGVGAMNDAAQCLLGVHDFSSFACADSDCESSIREIIEISVCRNGEHVIIDLRANAFLRSMVRVIVGTLVEIGLCLRQGSEMPGILEAKDRRAAGKTAPPQGLCLMEVEY